MGLSTPLSGDVRVGRDPTITLVLRDCPGEARDTQLASPATPRLSTPQAGDVTVGRDPTTLELRN